MKRMRTTSLSLLIAVPAGLALAFSQSATAQVPPDAGQLLQELRTAPLVPAPSPDFRVDPQAPTETAPGGAQVVVQRIELSGHSVFDEATLQDVLGEVAGQSFDLAGLRGLANRLTSFYHSSGYPFARAFLPAQTASDGVIRIEIVEGRYGEIRTQGDETYAARASSFVASLRPGEVIENRRLERTTLILDDQPGISISPVMRPGEALGTGDLDIRVTRERGIGAEVGLDNHGNRFTGSHRVRANLQADSPFLFGDQLSVRSLYTEEAMWLGSVTYSLPVGHSGLRGSVSYAHTEYELARDFKGQGEGDAKVATVGLSYPLVRSQQTNLTLSATYQHKNLYNQRSPDSSALDDDYSSQSVPVALQFDRRDSLGGGGITFGSATMTLGKLNLSRDMRELDISGLNEDRHGSFTKLNLDLVRLQALPGSFTLYGRFAGQWAADNLDSSEGLSLGGANGVRAYPSGEGSGDVGWLAQLELRYAIGSATPYVFYDAGHTRRNAKPTEVSGNEKTEIAGGGIGVRYQNQRWLLDAAAAWRGQDEPTADPKDPRPRFWVSATYRF